MPVLAERKKMTKEELEAIVPYILEIRKREQQNELSLLQQISYDEESRKADLEVLEEEEEKSGKRIKEIKTVKEKLIIVQKSIQEQELKLVDLQKEKHDLVLMFKKSLQMKHLQQQYLQQQQQQQQKQQQQPQPQPQHTNQ